MSLISKWFASTLAFATDAQNTPEIDLLDAFEAIEIDIPTIEAAEVQIKGANGSGGTFDLIGQEEPVVSSTGGFRTTVPLGGRYQFIKIYLSAAQTADRVFAVRGISYASSGLVGLFDRVKQLLTGVVLAAGTALIGKVSIDQVTANANEVVIKSGTVTAVTAITNALPAGDNTIGGVTKSDGTITTETAVASTPITVGATSTLIKAANTSRKYLSIQNDSDETMYLGTNGGAAVLNKGRRLNANGMAYEMSKELGNLYTGAVYGICVSGGKIALVVEGS